MNRLVRHSSAEKEVIRSRSNPAARARRNRPLVMQQRLKSPRTARAWVVAAELLDQFLLSAAHKAQPALDARFARETLTPLRAGLESRAGRLGSCVPRSPP